MDVILPEQIQRQLDEAAAIEAELYGKDAAPQEGNTEEAPAAAEQPVEPQAQQPAEDVAPPVTQPVVADETWEKKFNVLRGKYEAEVPRLHSQVRELTERLQAAVERLEKAEESKESEAQSRVTTADDEQFGQDLMDAVRRATQAEIARATKDIDKKVDAAVKPVAEKLVQSDTDRFWSMVDAAVPDFDQVNTDSRWFQFLDARIPGTRSTYRNAAEAAVAAHDAASLIEMIGLWKQQVAPATPSPQAQPQPDTRAQDELSRQVAPTSRRDAAQPQPQGRIWSAEEFSAAQDPRNRHHMTREDYEALVQESELALAEGRVKF